jgi:uncharacterized NAD(P)/FAD-binding protein YdhS
VFVGTGISNTFTVVDLLADLERQEVRSARVLLIDKDPDLFTGVPYGTRSGDLGLIISRLADFLPATHAEPFAHWLAENRDEAFERFFAVGGDFVATWRRQFWHDVETGAIDELYLPRYVLGLYFESIARAAIERAHRAGVATCETAVGEVVDLERTDGGFVVVTRDPDGREVTFTADRVVLGLGSAPSKRPLEALSATLTTRPECVLIDDPFDPGIADMLDRIREAASRSGTRDARVVIIGSNAGALDVIFNLMNDPALASAIGRIDVVSMSGRFPEPFTTHPEGFRSSFVCHALNELAVRESILADDIFDAVRDDIERARRDGLTITDTFWDISVSFNALLDRLSPAEKLRFAGETGTRIGALQRRVGRDYGDVVDRLIREGTLVVTRGGFPEAELRWGDEDLLAIVNCSGSGRLTSPELHSVLIRNLLERGWLRPTASDLGIQVNDDLETDTPGLYLIGPMLTGNVLRGGPTWNVEHCGRIALFARQLAAHLVERAFVGSAT